MTYEYMTGMGRVLLPIPADAPPAPPGMENEWKRPPAPGTTPRSVWEAWLRRRNCQAVNITEGDFELFQCPVTTPVDVSQLVVADSRPMEQQQPVVEPVVDPAPEFEPQALVVADHLVETEPEERSLGWVWLVLAATGLGAAVWFWKR